jgi:hypothetical protein
MHAGRNHPAKPFHHGCALPIFGLSASADYGDKRPVQ